MEALTPSSTLPWPKAIVYALGYAAACIGISFCILLAQQRITGLELGATNGELRPVIVEPDEAKIAKAVAKMELRRQPHQATDRVVIGILGGVMLSAVMLAWLIHHSWKLCVTLMVLVGPSLVIAGFASLAVGLRGLGRY